MDQITKAKPKILVGGNPVLPTKLTQEVIAWMLDDYSLQIEQLACLLQGKFRADVDGKFHYSKTEDGKHTLSRLDRPYRVKISLSKSLLMIEERNLCDELVRTIVTNDLIGSTVRIAAQYEVLPLRGDLFITKSLIEDRDGLISNGFYRYYGPVGVEEGNYLNGLRIGVWIYFYGSAQYKRFFNTNGEEVSEKEYNSYLLACQKIATDIFPKDITTVVKEYL